MTKLPLILLVSSIILFAIAILYPLEIALTKSTFYVLLIAASLNLIAAGTIFKKHKRI